MVRTISRLYDSHKDAAAAVEALEAQGVAHDDISLISSNAERWDEPRSFAPSDELDAHSERMQARDHARHDHDHHAHEHADNDAVHAQHGAGKGAAIGAGIGGGAVLLAGLGALAIPGMGPILAAGFLTSALIGAGAGAATGGMLGALRDAGVDEHDAHTYAEGVRRGGAMVSVRTDEADAARITEILARHGGADAESRRRDYEAAGWTGFDEAAEPYDADRIRAERSRFDPRI